MELTKDLPLKSELIDSSPKSPLLHMDVEFDDLRECTSEIFQKAFMDAWKVCPANSILQFGHECNDE